MAENPGGLLGNYVPISSGHLTNGVLGDTQALHIARAGVAGVEFPGRGRAPIIPWEQIKRIEVMDDKALFILYSDLVGEVAHDPGDKDAKDWYIKLEGVLITWSLQSGPKCVMPNGLLVYNQGVPRVVFKTVTEKSRFRKQSSSAQVVKGGLSIVSEVSPIFMYHEDFWEYVRKEKNETNRVVGAGRDG